MSALLIRYFNDDLDRYIQYTDNRTAVTVWLAATRRMKLETEDDLKLETKDDLDEESKRPR